MSTLSNCAHSPYTCWCPSKATIIYIWEVLLILLNLLQHLCFEFVLGPCRIPSHSFLKALLCLPSLEFPVKAKCPKPINTYAAYWQIQHIGFFSLRSLPEKFYCFSRVPWTSDQMRSLVLQVCSVSVSFSAPPWCIYISWPFFCISDSSGRGEFSSYFIKPICSYRSWLRNLAGRLGMGTF